MEKESKSVGLEKEDGLNRVRWRVGVGEIAVRVGQIQPPLFIGINPDQNWMMMMIVVCQRCICFVSVVCWEYDGPALACAVLRLYASGVCPVSATSW